MKKVDGQNKTNTNNVKQLGSIIKDLTWKPEKPFTRDEVFDIIAEIYDDHPRLGENGIYELYIKKYGELRFPRIGVKRIIQFLINDKQRKYEQYGKQTSNNY